MAGVSLGLGVHVRLASAGTPRSGARRRADLFVRRYALAFVLPLGGELNALLQAGHRRSGGRGDRRQDEDGRTQKDKGAEQPQ